MEYGMTRFNFQRYRVLCIMAAAVFLFCSCELEKDDPGKMDEESKMLMTINREREMNYALKAELIAAMDPMAQMLCHRDMDRISPDSLGIFSHKKLRKIPL